MYEFRIVERDKIPWDKIENCYDHTVFKSKAWMDFLIVTQSVEPFVVEIFDENKLAGFFVGEKFSKLFNIVASPFEGWTTTYQGLSMLTQISGDARINIYIDLISYLIKNRICSIIQISDWQLDMDLIKNRGLKYEVYRGYNLDLTQTEEQIYKKFGSSSCQRKIRKAHKNGIIVRETKDIDQFIYHYYKQLLEVFEKQGLKPTYKIDRVVALIDKLKLSDKLLLLEALSAEGICLATGVFVGDNKLAYFWGGASYTKYQNLCPNEPIMYEAIKYWKKKGYKDFDLAGIRKYKEKYGPDYFEKPKIIASRYYGVLILKNFAKRSYYGIRGIVARIKKVTSS
jgi:hypothetical protein